MKVENVAMRIYHKHSDTMEIDWAGDTILVSDWLIGESPPVYLFMTVLPCSSSVYVEDCSNMKRGSWLLCYVYVYNYFGGVARLLIPDNYNCEASH